MDTKKDFYMIRFHNMGENPQYDTKCCFRSEIKRLLKNFVKNIGLFLLLTYSVALTSCARAVDR
jgi:hypothetical protein